MNYYSILIFAVAIYFGVRYYLKQQKTKKKVEEKIQLLAYLHENFTIDETVQAEMKQMPVEYLKAALVAEGLMTEGQIYFITGTKPPMTLSETLVFAKDQIMKVVNTLKKKG